MFMTQLSHIQSPEDLRRLSPEQLLGVAKELRDFIIHAVATKEGHLGASLGVIELTVALHYVFHTPEDNLLWDVGHQAYGHKILTGRRDLFETNRQWSGISGFPSRKESPYDAFGVGHSSTAISAALGMALAQGSNPNSKDRTHIAVVGDASIASGMAIEGLNHAGATAANLLVILNDNQMGIDPAVGALKAHFSKLESIAKEEQQDQTAKNNSLDTSSKANFFTALGFTYTGVIDGHDLQGLIAQLKILKQQKGPRLLHIKTTKGKGLSMAEADQITYHAPGKFNVQTGERTPKPSLGPAKYQDVFGHSLLELAQQHPDIMAITPAMPTGSSLKYMMAAMPHRAFDVGIAEQHAVTLAAGMATAGKLPYCVIYSTFLQRAYDQLIHDVALQELPVVFCVDRAGLVGQDGATHHGVFDLAFLLPIPYMTIAAPSDEGQLRDLLFTATQAFDNKAHEAMGPWAIRYPRGEGVLPQWKKPFKKLTKGKGIEIKKGTKIAVLCLGPILHEVQKALSLLEASHPEASKTFGLYDMIFAKPFDQELLNRIQDHYAQIITLEDGVVQGGFGQAVASYLRARAGGQGNIKCTHWGVPDQFIGHGKPEKLYKSLGLDAASLVQKLTSYLTDETH